MGNPLSRGLLWAFHGTIIWRMSVARFFFRASKTSPELHLFGTAGIESTKPTSGLWTDGMSIKSQESQNSPESFIFGM
jgi:hypothetical protein